MSTAASQSIFAIFLIFCRVGSCLMVLPGYSSSQVSVRVRLMIAVVCSLAVAPVLMPQVYRAAGVTHAAHGAAAQFMIITTSEIAAGLMIGLIGRIFFLALEFASSAIALFLGYSGTPGTPIEESEPSATLGSIMNLTAVMLVFSFGLHLEVIRALVSSYSVIDVGRVIDVAMALNQLTIAVSKSFTVALQITGPLLLYSIVVNLLFGFANKLMPQLPIYFLSVPFIMAGGLWILILMTPSIYSLFIQAFGHWLVTGRLQ